MMTSETRAPAVAALLAATAAWGSLFLVSKPALAHIDPVWFTFVRYTLATALLSGLLAWQGRGAWQKLQAHGARLALTGFVGYGVFSSMVLIGLSHSLPSHGAVIMATMPITTQLVRWGLDGERPTRAALLGTALALAGVLLVSGVLLAGSQGRSTVQGDLVAWLGTLGWIWYTRNGARLPSFSPLQYTALTAISSWPLLLAGALATAEVKLSHVPSLADLALSWRALTYVAVVPSVAAVIAYNFGVRRLGVVTGTAFLNFVPVSALLMCTAVGAPPSMHELAGAALVVIALLVHTAGQGRAQSPERPRTRAGAGAGFKSRSVDARCNA
jgi:drug/metabolite transporter (DMT)-like permease